MRQVAGEAEAIASMLSTAMLGVLAPAIAFENAMVPVRQAVAFDSPEAFQAMGRDLQVLSTRIPATLESLADIMVIGGKANILPEDGLLRFTEDAARMGLAFSMAAGEAGTAMADLRQQFGLTQEEVARLVDGVGYVSGALRVDAPDVLASTVALGDAGAGFGLSGQQTTALGATFATMGADPAEAAASTDALFTALSSADASSAGFQKALAVMGLSAAQLKAAVAEDAQGALLGFLEAVRETGDAEGTLGSVVDARAAGGLSHLVDNLDTYHQALALSADENAAAAAMEQRYQIAAGTTANQLLMTQNALSTLGATLGTLLLPEINAFLMVLNETAMALNDFAIANPELFKWALGFMLVTAGALKVVSVVLNVIDTMAALWQWGEKATQGLRKGFSWALPRISKVYAGLRTLSKLFMTSAMDGIKSFGLGVGRVAGIFKSSLIPAFRTAAVAAWAWLTPLLSNPITWIILGIVAAAALIYVYWEPIKKFFTDLWNYISGLFFGAWEAIKSSFLSSWEAIKGYLSAVWSYITGLFEKNWVDGILGILATFNPLALMMRAYNALIAYLTGFDLAAEGARIIQTLWQGMMSMVDKPAEAMAHVVGLVRQYLPFSPAKVGPLADLDHIRLVETVAETVTPDSLTTAIGNVAQNARETLSGGLITPLAAAWNAVPSMEDLGAWLGFAPAAPAMAPSATMPSPRLAAMPAAGSAAATAGAPVSVTIPITIQGDASDGTVQRLERWARENGRLLADLVLREQMRTARMSFGG